MAENGFSPARRSARCRVTRALTGRRGASTVPGVGQDLSELFDVVDEHDRVIGQAPRGEVHARGLRHRAVHVFVTNRAGEVFLHQRSLTKDTFPGRWNSSCAGHVGAGDDYDETVLRELEEELGCVPAAAPRRLFKIEARPETGEEFVWVYRVEAEGPFRLEPAEIQRGAWFAPAEVDRWLAARPDEFARSFLFLWPQVRGMR
ncbi:MAG: NUDIX domain-containing protein [Candidatus Didemnitutus sp.]|nr:NUDIX domain-containing protein [Candidatus Didemnitutus sp.]